MSSGGDDLPHEEHEEHANHESWVIPYADLLTLLMAMFIALFAISSVNVDKAKRVSAGFNQALGGKPLSGLFASASAGHSVAAGTGSKSNSGSNDGGNVGPGENPKGKSITNEMLVNNERLTATKSSQQVALKDVKNKIEAAAKKLGLDKQLSFDLQERGLVVRVVSDNVLFKSGDANLQPDGEKVLALVGEVLKSVDNPLWIEGNTDDRPVAAGSVYKSNYGLSTLRAESVLLYLAQTVGLDETRMRPTGWGSTHPIATNATEEGRAKNRRVEIVVVSKAVDAALSAGGLTDAPASATPAKPNLGTIGTSFKITP